MEDGEAVEIVQRSDVRPGKNLVHRDGWQARRRLGASQNRSLYRWLLGTRQDPNENCGAPRASLLPDLIGTALRRETDLQMRAYSPRGSWNGES